MTLTKEDTSVQKLIINVGTEKAIQAAITAGEIGADELCITTDGKVLSDYVDLTSTQTISGTKTFTDKSPVSKKTTQDNGADAGFYIVRLTAVDSTTSPATETFGGMRIYDGKGSILGDFRSVKQTDGTQYSAMMARSSQSGTQTTAAIGVQVDANGDVSAYGTQNGKRAFANLPMPSSSYTELTLGASGTVYTASDTGWVVIRKQTNSTNQYIRLFIQNSLLGNQISAASSGTDIETYIPVKKGDKFSVGYNAGGTTQRFRFIKAQGVA